MYNCAFVRHSKCPFTISTVEFEDNTWEINVTDVEHNDHKEDMCIRGMLKHLKIALAAQAQTKTPKQLQIFAAEEQGQVITGALKGQIASFQLRERR